MTDFAQERPSLRSRGASHLKLNLLQQQHPLDMGLDDRDMDIDLDEMVDYDTSLPSVHSLSKHAGPTTAESVVPFVSAHPSPEVSDESDGERERERNLSLSSSKDAASSSMAISDRRQVQATSSTSSSSAMPVPVAVPAALSKNKSSGRRSSHLHHQAPDAEEELSFHLLLSPIPIPKQQQHSRSHHARRTPPQSPLNSFSNSLSNSLSFKRSSFSSSMHTPPGSATAAFPVPCSDSALVDELIRNNVRQHMRSHATEKAYFWSLGKLSEFSFSDRFVRSPVFDIKDTAPAAELAATTVVTSSNNCEASSIPTDSVLQSQAESTKSSWRLRLYPHGRGDRHRDSEYVGLYLQQENTGPAINRRLSAIPGANAINAAAAAATFSSSVPAPFTSRSSVSAGSRRSVSAMSLPMTRRHVTLFVATEAGDCIAKQDLVEWFSGSEGGLGFPRFVLRKTVLDAVKKQAMTFDDDEDDEEGEMNIVAGVIFHDL
ncbi:hypothetical protein BG015_007604 [Linnemannia schmuckeri]|uniref:Uncharacterized protein n=1 Tax=Linnemannia schmuckeri TaxID=64567 RepID=A0A9P5RY97_9FUNG|nr:hypothetical protein BG015_007604 [Linnemannia schmuckeri]